jgi:2-dehydro-3-deoxyphosphogalactonate aldolase
MDRFGLFDAAFQRMPLIAILRGLTAERAPDVARLLNEGGFTLAEVPLNGDNPYEAIDALRRAAGSGLVVGAGTVLSTSTLARAQEAGAAFAVAPNFDERVTASARADFLPFIPGVQTPSEAFRAIEAGVAGLKLFPAEAIGPRVIPAWRQVMPPRLRLIPVGGITVESLERWWEAGASGFGIGGPLFRSGKPVHEIRNAASAYAGTMRRLMSAPPP